MDNKIINISINGSSSDDDDIYVNAAARLESLRAKSFSVDDDEPIPSLKKDKTNVSDHDSSLTVNNLETTKHTKVEENANINGIIPNLSLSDVIEIDDDDDNDGPQTRSKRRRRLKKNNNDIRSVVESPKCSFNLTIESVDTSTQSIELSDEEIVDLSVVVKIRWISRDIKRFEFKKDENFSKVFKYFASLANVDEKRILITRNEIPISPLDTPSSLKLSIIDILEGGFINECVQIKPVEDDTSKIKIKVQSSSKKSWNFDFKKDEKFKKIFDHCAKENNVPITKLKCYFDGESIVPTDTPDDLDIEDEACFDLKIIS